MLCILNDLVRNGNASKDISKVLTYITVNSIAHYLTEIQRRCSLCCGVAQFMLRRCSVMLRRCSVRSASACCKAGPSSILGSAPQGGFSHWAYKRWRNGERPRRMAMDKCIVWMWSNERMYVCYKIWKINKKSGIMPPNLWNSASLLTRISPKT